MGALQTQYFVTFNLMHELYFGCMKAESTFTDATRHDQKFRNADLIFCLLFW